MAEINDAALSYTRHGYDTEVGLPRFTYIPRTGGRRTYHSRTVAHFSEFNAVPEERPRYLNKRAAATCTFGGQITFFDRRIP